MKILYIVKTKNNSQFYFEDVQEPQTIPTNLVNWDEVEKLKIKIMSSYTDLIK